MKLSTNCSLYPQGLNSILEVDLVQIGEIEKSSEMGLLFTKLVKMFMDEEHKVIVVGLGKFKLAAIAF